MIGCLMDRLSAVLFPTPVKNKATPCLAGGPAGKLHHDI